MEKFEIRWEGKIYDCEWHDETNFERLDDVISASGFIFDDDMKLCLIKVNDHKNWALPGGHVEDCDKTFEDALAREAEEEADIELKDIQRLGYVRGFPREEPEAVNVQLRFAARVKKINPQTIDPAEGEFNERKFINPEDFDRYTHWDDTTSGLRSDFQLKKAIEKMNDPEKNKKREKNKSL